MRQWFLNDMFSPFEVIGLAVIADSNMTWWQHAIAWTVWWGISWVLCRVFKVKR